MAQGKAFTPQQREKIIKSLQPYLEMGFSRNKACEFIGLKPQTLSVWVQDDEALLMRLTSWENAINTVAINNMKQAVMKESELDDDLRKENTKWWLERRMKQEFSTRLEQTGADGEALVIQFADTFNVNTTPQAKGNNPK